MVTDEQKKWIDHLSTNPIAIVPFNPNFPSLFEKQKKELLKILGNDVEIVHRGASNMGISGKGELDIYIPVPVQRFDEILEKLVHAYGEPRSLYSYERARFNSKVDGVHAEIFLINEEAIGWKQGTVFETYLKTHPEDLKIYEQLKASLHGSTTKEYYRKKTEFFNSILEKAGYK